MTKLLHFYYFILFCVPFSASAQNTKEVIQGRVIDFYTKLPLVGACIWNNDTPQKRICTDSDGKYSLETTKGNVLIVCNHNTDYQEFQGYTIVPQEDYLIQLLPTNPIHKERFEAITAQKATEFAKSMKKQGFESDIPKSIEEQYKDALFTEHKTPQVWVQALVKKVPTYNLAMLKAENDCKNAILLKISSFVESAVKNEIGYYALPNDKQKAYDNLFMKASSTFSGKMQLLMHPSIRLIKKEKDSFTIFLVCLVPQKELLKMLLDSYENLPKKETINNFIQKEFSQNLNKK